MITAMVSICFANDVADTRGFNPPETKLEILGKWSVDLVAPVWELGQTSDLDKRRIIPITGGKFEGPNFKGKILNNGADGQVLTKDGLAIIDTRYLLQTDDGALVFLTGMGLPKLWQKQPKARSLTVIYIISGCICNLRPVRQNMRI